MANTDVRMEIMKRGLRNYQVAEFVGVTETTFSKWLRTELPTEKKQQILTAINENCEMSEWKPIDRINEHGNKTDFVETSKFPNEPEKYFVHNCNLTTCRYNKDGKCTSEEDRKICVDVAKKVLCVGESEEDGCNC